MLLLATRTIHRHIFVFASGAVKLSSVVKFLWREKLPYLKYIVYTYIKVAEIFLTSRETAFETPLSTQFTSCQLPRNFFLFKRIEKEVQVVITFRFYARGRGKTIARVLSDQTQFAGRTRLKINAFIH